MHPASVEYAVRPGIAGVSADVLLQFAELSGQILVKSLSELDNSSANSSRVVSAASCFWCFDSEVRSATIFVRVLTCSF